MVEYSAAGVGRSFRPTFFPIVSIVRVLAISSTGTATVDSIGARSSFILFTKFRRQRLIVIVVVSHFPSY